MPKAAPVGDKSAWRLTRRGRAAAGVGLAGGFLRASFGQGRVESIVGVGYSHPLARQSMGLFGTFGVGVDLAGAYDISSQQSYQSRAARLAIPLSIRWGSPTRF